MSRTKLAVLVSAIVLAFAVAGGVIWMSGFGRGGGNTSSSADQSITAPVFTDANADMLEAALSSSGKTEQAKALTPDLRTGEWSAEEVMPEGAILTIDRGSFAVNEGGYGSVTATVSGTVEGEFILHLVPIDGQWLVYMTEQKR